MNGGDNLHKGTEQILKQRYLWEWKIDDETIQETPEQMFLRVAKKMASAYLHIKKDYSMVRKLANKFYEMMTRGRFIPSSPQLFNAMRGFGNGQKHYDIIYKDIAKMTDEEWDVINEFKNSKSAYGSCYAMGRIGDSIDEIYTALKEQAIVFKSAGGYGTSFSNLRSEGTLVSTTMGESCGPIEFMDLFNMNTQKIALSGRTKRGANMFSLSVSHPDIEKFILRKAEMIEDDKGQIRPKYLEHVNTSIEITDGFMEALENNGDWKLIDPHTKEVKKTVKAKKLWDLMIDTVYKSGDPNILMLDNMNRFNPIWHIERINSVNPCNEYSGYDKTVCNLGSINLYALRGTPRAEGFAIDFKLMEDTVINAVIFLNLALMANDYPLESLTQRSRDFRPIGLGFMGLGSIIMREGLEYGTEISTAYTKDLVEDFVYWTVKGSNLFYKMSGIRFKHYEDSDYARGEFYFRNDKHHKEISQLLKEGITNSRLNAIAPNGSIGMLAAFMTSEAAAVSGGVEPIFSLNYTRKVNPNTDQEFTVDQDDIAVKDSLRGYGYSEEEIRKILDGDPAYAHILKESRFKTAEELSTEQHLAILEVVSNAIDMSVSKTINLPESATKEEISELYKKAYKMGLKGITVFRSGSRQAVLESKSKKKKPDLQFDLGLTLSNKGKVVPKERPTVIQALKKSVRFKAPENGGVKIINIELGFDEKNEPFEVFIRATTSTQEYTELFNAIGRLVSMALRSNADIDSVLKQVRKVKNWKNEYSYICQIISSTVEELAEVGKTKSFKKKQEVLDKINKAKLLTHPKGYLTDQETGESYCPICMAKQGEGLVFESGCVRCTSCGWAGCNI